MVSRSPPLPFELGDPSSILGRTSTEGLKIIEEKELPLHNDVKIVGTSDPLSIDNSLLGNSLTNE